MSKQRLIGTPAPLKVAIVRIMNPRCQVWSQVAPLVTDDFKYRYRYRYRAQEKRCRQSL